MKAYQKVEYIKFDGNNTDEVEAFVKANIEPIKGINIERIYWENREVSVPEWKANRVTIPVFTVEYYETDPYEKTDMDIKIVTKYLHCLKGQVIVVIGGIFYIEDGEEFERKYVVDLPTKPKEDWSGTLLKCSECPYKNNFVWPNPNHINPYATQYPFQPYIPPSVVSCSTSGDNGDKVK